MKLKPLYVSVFAVIMSVMFSITALAADFIEELPSATFKCNSIEAKKDKAAPANDEKKTGMEAKIEESRAKWEALSEDQKEEIYKIKDRIFDAECEIVDKYLELGIIDNETGARMRTKMMERKSEMRKSGKMPLYGSKGKR